MSFTTTDPKIATAPNRIQNTRQAPNGKRYELFQINCSSKEALRQMIGQPFPLDTKGEIRCVTNPDNTFNAAVNTHIELRSMLTVDEETGEDKEEVFEVTILNYVC